MEIGFWFFMLASLLLIPAVMVGFGMVCKKNPPKSINGWYGYRTKRSMASQEAWDFAHQVCGQLWRKAGLWMLPLSILAMVPALWLSVGGIGLWGTGVVALQTVVMIATIFPVERALKRNFDRFGHRIKQ